MRCSANSPEQANSSNSRRTVVRAHPGIDGLKTHQETQAAANPPEQNWQPEQRYNPYDSLPVFPKLSGQLGDVRDQSKARILWQLKKSEGTEENEVMERIMGLFGLETFKEHCLRLYSVLIALPAEMRFNVGRDADILLIGSKGVGKRLAALRYRELLRSLGVIRGPPSVYYFTSDPASAASFERILDKILSQDVVNGPVKENVSSGPFGKGEGRLTGINFFSLLTRFPSLFLFANLATKTTHTGYSTDSRDEPMTGLAELMLAETSYGSAWALISLRGNGLCWSLCHSLCSI